MSFYHDLRLELILPEIVLGIAALSMLIIGAFKGDRLIGRFLGGAFIATLFAGILLIWGEVFSAPEALVAMNGLFVIDDFIVYCKLLILIGAGVVLLLSLHHVQREQLGCFEYPILLIIATVGMMLMVSSNDLMGLFMGLELQSLSLYVLVAMRRDRASSTEAALKYFILGTIASCCILYGSSLLYGFSGSTTFQGIMSVIDVQEHIPLYIIFAGGIIIAGLSFKISAAPFHMWTPDVYQGTPTLVTTFLAAAPKVAAFAILTRIVGSVLEGLESELSGILQVLAAISMIWAAFGGLYQSNIKRLLAYSAIGHMGYALMGLAAGVGGIQAVLIYISLYLVMSLGAFALLLLLEQLGSQPGYKPIETLESLYGLAKTRSGIAVMLTLLMFSMAGIPPLAGFLAKLVVFQAAVDKGLYLLALIGVLSSVVAAAFYLKVIKAMWFEQAENTKSALEGSKLPIRVDGVIIGAAIGITTGCFFYPGPLLKATQLAAHVFS